MAPYINVLVPLAFGALGLWAFVAWPLWAGLLAFVGLFLIGSWIGTVLFKRLATPQQIKDDLEARLHND